MNRVFCLPALMLGAAACVAGLQGTARADAIVVQHQGVADPATEGFTSNTGTATSGTVNWPMRTSPDPGWDGVNNNSPTGEDAWWVASKDPNAPNYKDSFGNYTYAPTSTDLANMNSLGWKAEMRLLNGVYPDNATDYGVGMELLTTTRDFEIYIGTDSSNNVTLYKWVSGGLSPVTIPAIDAYHAYHTYAMSAAPGASQATISIDGTAVGTVDSVDGTYAPVFGFGSFSGNGRFSADYSHVTLSTIPEPASMCMLASGFIGLLAYAWRKRK